MKKLTLLYLVQAQCPFVVDDDGKYIIISSTRVYLLLLGWIIDYLDLFEKFDELLQTKIK